MRSLVVTTWFPDHDNPSRTPFCLAHVHAIRSAGDAVSVVHVQLGRIHRKAVDEDYEGVQVTRFSLDIRSPLSYVRLTRMLIRRFRETDVVHTMAFSSVLVTAPAWMLRRRPWVHTEHWNGVTNPASVGRLWNVVSFLRFSLKLPHAVTAVTTQLADGMARYCRRGAVSVVPCVVEPVPVTPFPVIPPVRIIGVGLVIERKNPLLAIETIATLVRKGVDVRFTWVGDGPLLGQARARLHELHLDGRVTFTGAVRPTQVPALVQDAHLFFVPSSQENFFTAVAEAIVGGRPAVVPMSGGFDDYCTPENSVLLDTWDVETLATGVVTAIKRFEAVSPSEIARTIDDRFSTVRVGAVFSRIYREVA